MDSLFQLAMTNAFWDLSARSNTQLRVYLGLPPLVRLACVNRVRDMLKLIKSRQSLPGRLIGQAYSRIDNLELALVRRGLLQEDTGPVPPPIIAYTARYAMERVLNAVPACPEKDEARKAIMALI